MNPQHRLGNQKADELATKGAQNHQEDLSTHAKFNKQMDLILHTQKYILRRQGQLADKKITNEQCKNADGTLPCRRNRKGRGRPREPDKLHSHHKAILTVSRRMNRQR